jgi:hypothetical protein
MMIYFTGGAYSALLMFVIFHIIAGLLPLSHAMPCTVSVSFSRRLSFGVGGVHLCRDNLFCCRALYSCLARPSRLDGHIDFIRFLGQAF